MLLYLPMGKSKHLLKCTSEPVILCCECGRSTGFEKYLVRTQGFLFLLSIEIRAVGDSKYAMRRLGDGPHCAPRCDAL